MPKQASRSVYVEAELVWKTLSPHNAFLQTDFLLVLCSTYGGLLMGVLQFSVAQKELRDLSVK